MLLRERPGPEPGEPIWEISKKGITMTRRAYPFALPLGAVALSAVAIAQALGGDAGDDCTRATLIVEGTYLGDTLGATTDGNADCADSATSPDVWYRFIPAESALLALSLCGSSYDTMLSVHSSCPGDETNQLGCNDDFDCDGDGDVADDGYVSSLRIPVEAGTPYLIRVSGWNGASGSYVLDVGLQEDIGADVLIGEINQFVQFGRLGDIVGCSLDSPVCNAGTQPLDWHPVEDGRHPFMVFNMYRLMNDRMEHIGQSWVKHGFASAQADACGLGCTPHPDSTRTGVGCSDTYSAGLNANQGFLGPRSEINPWMPSYAFEGSHLDTASPNHDAIEHRLQLKDADLDPALNPGAQYFCELYVLAHDDVDHLNSIAHEPVAVSGVPGGTWSFDVSGSSTDLGPAIGAWPAAVITIIPEVVVDDGRVFLAAKAIDLGNGGWHYEYALYNHDMARPIGTFAIPVDPCTTVTNVGFSAVRSHDDPFSNDPWEPVRTSTAIEWSTDAFGGPSANPIRWGTLYNFRFDADVEPDDTTATLGLFAPGELPSSLTGTTRGPRLALAADVNGDGVVNVLDLIDLLLCFGLPAVPGCEAEDVNTDGTVNVLDLIDLLLVFGTACS